MASWSARSCIYRQEVRPFTDKQIALVHEFRRAGRDRDREHAAAERAAPRTDDLRVAEQQTATSRSAQGHHLSSPGDLSRYSRPCWRTPAHLRGKFGVLFLCEGDAFAPSRCKATCPPAFNELSAATWSSQPGPVNALTEPRRPAAVHMSTIFEDAAYLGGVR